MFLSPLRKLQVSHGHCNAKADTFFPDIGLRSITEFPGAAGILIAALEAALEAEQGKPQPERQWKVLRALIKMLAAFPSLPIEFISKYRVQKLQELANTAQTDKESRRAMYGFVKLFDHGEMTLLLRERLLRNVISQNKS